MRYHIKCFPDSSTGYHSYAGQGEVGSIQQVQWVNEKCYSLVLLLAGSFRLGRLVGIIYGIPGLPTEEVEIHL